MRMRTQGYLMAIALGVIGLAAGCGADALGPNANQASHQATNSARKAGKQAKSTANKGKHLAAKAGDKTKAGARKMGTKVKKAGDKIKTTVTTGKSQTGSKGAGGTGSKTHGSGGSGKKLGSKAGVKKDDHAKKSHTTAGARGSAAHGHRTVSDSRAGGSPNLANGSAVYASDCASCHGSSGQGTVSGSRLASPSNVVGLYSTSAALTTFVAHNMPTSDPGKLSATQATDVSAYVWKMAGG